jgi:hypothetical protein
VFDGCVLDTDCLGSITGSKVHTKAAHRRHSLSLADRVFAHSVDIFCRGDCLIPIVQHKSELSWLTDNATCDADEKFSGAKPLRQSIQVFLHKDNDAGLKRPLNKLSGCGRVRVFEALKRYPLVADTEGPQIRRSAYRPVYAST